MSYSPTSQGQIEALIESKVSTPTIGQVTKVYEHTDPDDDSNLEVDVLVENMPTSDGQFEDYTYRRVAIAQPHAEAAFVPSKGDSVLLTFIEKNNPIVIGYVYTAENRAVLAGEGVIRFKRDDLYTEMDGFGDWVRFSKKASADDDRAAADALVELDDTNDGGPIARAEAGNGSVEVDDSGSETVVTIESEGDVTINVSNGDVNVSANSLSVNGGGKPVLIEGAAVVEDGHSHTYTDADGNTNTTSTESINNGRVADGEGSADLEVSQ